MNNRVQKDKGNKKDKKETAKIIDIGGIKIKFIGQIGKKNAKKMAEKIAKSIA